MMSLGDDKVRCATFFYGTDSICLGSIDNNNEQRRTQNKEKEVLYQAVKEAFWLDYLPIQGEQITKAAKLSKAASRNWRYNIISDWTTIIVLLYNTQIISQIESSSTD